MKSDAELAAEAVKGRRDEKDGVYNKAAKAPNEGISRNCLRCDKAFKAENKFLRLCASCRPRTS